ncbi:hypothetical protein LOZ64_005985 [Ophidiomyces ophidiicola]|nr:hypothetical protein LOZ64_005985 [Ophidiomyces ophidiicola]KAI2007017.1 hypothetical protein LOZ49_004805 [Ophidiomyces ophidiicola]KAI2023270.1 hypothetical protein LOZ46_001601 [Ophidiomyces ophidiicola]KAI2129920.1 hypothetical protein LOZ29_005903 [Ophidiomyces ophidiicola]KAI2132149.1 hypothetical protein LOZ28_005987 [Ophidiomyces ophidiicola]
MGRRGRTVEENYYEERFDRRPAVKELVKDRRERVFEEDIEVRHRPTRLFKERIRSSSAGALVLRKRVSDEFVRVPREAEEVHILQRERRPPVADFELDERIIHRREKSRAREPVRIVEDEAIIHERDYDSDHFSRRSRRRPTGHSREINVEIDHGAHRDEINYHSTSRDRCPPPRPKFEEREDILIRTENKRERTKVAAKDEILIRKEINRSPSPKPSIAPSRPIHAPPIHQDAIMHHRHVDHGYDIHTPRRVREESKKRVDIDEIDIRERRGRNTDDLQVIHRREKGYESSPSPRRHVAERDEVMISHTSSNGRERERDTLVIRDREGHHDHRDRADIMAEADHYNRRATVSSSIGEAYNGATRDWATIEVPPGTKRVTLDGVGGASQEISWQRYNGLRRSKFRTDGEEYCSDFGFELDNADIGRRYAGLRKPERLWTEITKDLVVKEAIEKVGYEYEETEEFFYVFSYLRYDDVAHLVRLSDEFRHARRERIREIQAERAIKHAPLALPAPPIHSTTVLIDRSANEDRVSEHDLVIETDRRHFRGRRW